ncbi:phosphoketolase family protein [Filimonas effusa]|uniref:Phosphoketolase family protein n=1 Tax=Filimonas effusa TaxID=2508721 RepID=A0A4Q1DAC0_9BACT|nr:phosphoketolase family protein [Filimonas effusa]RXK86327.1 phosphoketolase family protein [Filimonas effusa]
MYTLSPNESEQLHAYWRAANYLSAGQIYLHTNALLKEPLKSAHIKPRLLGHWGTCPGLNLVYTHLNRLIIKNKASVLFVAGPGHGAPAVLSQLYLEGSYSAFYPQVTQDEAGMNLLFRQFSTPYGMPSHVTALTPGSIHEGGELGYSLVHAFGAVFDNPDVIAACVIGDGEAETGALAASWQSIHFLNPARDGAVLPILHINGYKISSLTILARMSDAEITSLFSGLGYQPYFVTGDDAVEVHEILATALDQAYRDIKHIQQQIRQEGLSRPQMAWPMIVLRTPKGWTCPEMLEGKQLEGSFRSHQVPIPDAGENEEQLKLLESWLRSYDPASLFTDTGHLQPLIQSLVPPSELKMGMHPAANGGILTKPLQLPEYSDYAVEIDKPGITKAGATKETGKYLADVFRFNDPAQNFRLFCPDETSSNKLNAVFEATERCFTGPLDKGDDKVSATGRVMEVLSEHLCQGWYEGYLLTGRHGLFACYEAFITIIDSMMTQYAKWLKLCHEVSWRRPIPSLNYLLTSHAWRQDHNGYSHQGPGFIDAVISKKNHIIRIYLPPDANSLLAVTHHCLQTTNYINVIIAGKQPSLQWLTVEDAARHCEQGASIWEWAGNEKQNEEGIENNQAVSLPHVVLTCAGDVPTLETIAAAWLLRKHLPALAVRVVNVVDLMSLAITHPHALEEDAFARVFTEEQPVVFAFHGYPRVIHDLVHGRPSTSRFHVRGYAEEGTTTTPFDMVVLNSMSRYHLAIKAIRESVLNDTTEANNAIALFERKLQEHTSYIKEHMDDMPEIANWHWS